MDVNKRQALEMLRASEKHVGNGMDGNLAINRQALIAIMGWEEKGVFLPNLGYAATKIKMHTEHHRLRLTPILAKAKIYFYRKLPRRWKKMPAILLMRSAPCPKKHLPPYSRRFLSIKW